MRLLTLNTWKNGGNYTKRMQAIAFNLKQINPDIIFLQEVFQAPSLNLDTAQFIKNQFNFHVAMAPARQKMRKHLDQEVLSSSGLAILSRFPIIRHNIIPLPEDPRDGERIAQFVQISIGEDQHILCINLHLSHLRDAKSLRIKQLESIMHHMLGKREDQICILAGDFNATINSKELSYLTEAPHFAKDSFDLKKAKSNLPIERPKTVETRAIDFIFFLPDIHQRYPHVNFTEVTLNTIDDTFGVQPSDHAAVVVDFS